LQGGAVTDHVLGAWFLIEVAGTAAAAVPPDQMMWMWPPRGCRIRRA
jgi:hypothetical protein